MGMSEWSPLGWRWWRLVSAAAAGGHWLQQTLDIINTAELDKRHVQSRPADPGLRPRVSRQGGQHQVHLRARGYHGSW